MSALGDLNAAVEDLRKRERTPLRDRIHWLDRCDGQADGIDPDVANLARAWLTGRRDADAMVWTGLCSNWDCKRKRAFSPEDAILYLRELIAKDRSSSAEDYIRNAPAPIRTAVRELVEKEFGWTPNPLSDVLFEEHT